MFFITLLVLLFVILFDKIVNKKFGFLTLYTGVWFVSIALTWIKQGDIIGISEEAHYIVILGTLSFSIGYLIVSGLSRDASFSRREQFHSQSSTYIMRVSFLKYLLGFVALFYLIQAVKVHALFAMGLSMDTIRYEYVTKGEIMLPVEQIIASWITAPIVQYLIIPINIWNFLFNDDSKSKKVIILFSLLDVFLYMYVMLGKENLIFYSFSLLLIIFQFRIKKSARRKIFFALLLVFLVVCFLSFLRSDGQSKGVSFVYGYLAISLNLLDNWVGVIDNQHIQSYGLGFFYGPVNIVTSILEQFGFQWDLFSKISDFVSESISTGITVFPEEGPKTNVYVTHHMFFYMDYGYIGVCVENFIYGFITAVVLNKSRKLHNTGIYYKLVENVFCVGALCCFIYWPYFSTPYCMSFLMLRLCFKKVKYNAYASKSINNYSGF